jgi:hypothetical protein
MSEPQWAVVCDNYVSHHGSRADAVLHMRNTRGGQCKAIHQVIQTTLPAGSRLREDKKK